MKIKINSLLVKKETNLGNQFNGKSAFKVKDIIFNADPNTVKASKDDGDVLRCLKGCIKDNENMISYLETTELVNSSNVLWNNFHSEDEFLRVCKFEYRDYLDLSNCKVIYS